MVQNKIKYKIQGINSLIVVIEMSKDLSSELRIVLDSALREAADNIAQRQREDDRRRVARGALGGGRGQRGRAPQRARGRGRAGRTVYHGAPTRGRGRGPVAPNVPDIASDPVSMRTGKSTWNDSKGGSQR